MKTHIVIDLVYLEDEGNQAIVIDLVYLKDGGNQAFVGTLQECNDWVAEQGFGYKVVPMTEEELLIHNR